MNNPIYTEIEIKTQYATFTFKVNNIYCKDHNDLQRYIERAKRSIKQGSLGSFTDWTVGNHGQANAPKLSESSAKHEILSSTVVW